MKSDVCSYVLRSNGMKSMNFSVMLKNINNNISKYFVSLF